MKKYVEPGSYNCVLRVTRKWHEMFKSIEKYVKPLFLHSQILADRESVKVIPFLSLRSFRPIQHCLDDVGICLTHQALSFVLSQQIRDNNNPFHL